MKVTATHNRSNKQCLKTGTRHQGEKEPSQLKGRVLVCCQHNTAVLEF